VLLVHPGGPFWARRDDGAWSVPKGEHGPGEDPLAVARREFLEELGVEPPATASPVSLGEVRQAGGKRVRAWAIRGDVDPATIRSNTFAMEWPPRSGRTKEFPEVDRAAWFDLTVARTKLVSGQVGFLDRLAELVGP
jgi:predicted NUDIX family NTP pyrophosphohydrolase